MVVPCIALSIAIKKYGIVLSILSWNDTLLQCSTIAFAIHLFHILGINPLFEGCNSGTIQSKMGCSYPHSLWSRMWLSNWSKYLNIRRNFSYSTPLSKVVYFILLFYGYIGFVMFRYIINGLCSSLIFNSIYTLVWKWLIIVDPIHLFQWKDSW
jgi:hypothetical protein